MNYPVDSGADAPRRGTRRQRQVVAEEEEEEEEEGQTQRKKRRQSAMGKMKKGLILTYDACNDPETGEAIPKHHEDLQQQTSTLESMVRGSSQLPATDFTSTYGVVLVDLHQNETGVPTLWNQTTLKEVMDRVQKRDCTYFFILIKFNTYPFLSGRSNIPDDGRAGIQFTDHGHSPRMPHI